MHVSTPVPIIVICLAIGTMRCWAVESVAFHREASQSPICGLLCVQAAFEAYDVPAPSLEQLTKARYLSSVEGSSADDLALAIRDFGLEPSIITGLSPRSLLAFDKPVLLRIKKPATQMRHWVLYSGSASGGYLLADLPSPPHKFTEAELSAMWSGTAVAVDDSGMPALRANIAWLALEVLPLLTLPIIGLVLAHRFWNRIALAPLRQCLIICSVALVFSAYRHCIMTDGFARNADTLRAVSYRYAGSDDVKQFRSFGDIDADAPIFVDARFPGVYRKGHLPGAVNIPTYATKHERVGVLSGVANDAELVVYCESARCVFADVVARNLILDGFQNVVVYAGGWQDWKETRTAVEE